MKKNNRNNNIVLGAIFTAAFAIWTVLIQLVDVQPIGQNGTDIGFSGFNSWFHNLTGVNMTLYSVTDWMGIVPIIVCMAFAGIGLAQLIKRRSLHKVDPDIIILGIYFIIVILAYSFFEIIPINYRPIKINGMLEASYPSSTTLLVLCVMPALIEQSQRRVQSNPARLTVTIATVIFTAFMVIGRVISGVHWITDIIGALLLSAGLFSAYKAAVLQVTEKTNKAGNNCGIS